jgi:hypothetical protein
VEIKLKSMLFVSVVPVCRPGQANIIGVGRGEIARVACEVESLPPPTDYIWKFNSTGESVELSGGHYTTELSHSIATYTPATEHDFGSLMCWARNQLGTMRHPCVYHLIPAGIFE